MYYDEAYFREQAEQIEQIRKALTGYLVVAEQSNNASAKLTAQVQQTGELVTGLSKTVKQLQDESETMTTRITQLEESTELLSTQCDALNDLIKSHVTEMLKYGSYDYYVYFGAFCLRLRSDAHKIIGVPSRMSKVTKRDFGRYRDFIEAWIPTGGVSALKKEVENHSKVRKNMATYSYLLQS